MSFDILQGKRILLVEDDDISQFLMKKMLEDSGVVLTMVSNGLEAIELTKQHSFDLIIMDIEMPVIDGFQTTREIRALESNPNSIIPIIGISANPFDDNLNSYGTNGMNDYISKPVYEQSLIEKLCTNL